MKKIIVIFAAFLFITSIGNSQFKNLSGSKKEGKEPTTFYDIIDVNVGEGLQRSQDLELKINQIKYLFLDKNIKPIAFNESGQPIAFEGLLPEGKRSSKDILTQSKDYLEAIKSAIGIKNPHQEVELIKEVTDEDQTRHIKLNQTYQGIPIYGKEIWMHATRNGDVGLVNGNWTPTPEIQNVTPRLDESEAYALLKEKENFTNKVYLPSFLRGETKKSLVIYIVNDETPRLAYHISDYPDGVHRWDYFVDANTGEVFKIIENTCQIFHPALKNIHCASSQNKTYEVNPTYTIDLTDNLPHLEMDPLNTHVVMSGQDLLGVTRQVNSLQSGTNRIMMDINRAMFKATSVLPNKPDGVLWTIDAFNGSPENDDFEYDHVTTTTTTWSNPTAVSSQHNMALSYNYFKNNHSRNAVNGQGGNIISLINVAESDGKTMGNAFWNGAAMFYGNGDEGFFPLARGLDVAGHEMSHGVVQSTANLEYEGESGALNESFADIFGAMIDRDDWLIGEDVVKRAVFPSGALRSLQDPHNGAQKDDYGAGFQPKLYSERYRGTQDNGGVHINSGIPNYAFFLFASNPNVGKDRAEKIFYRALNLYLTKSSQFIDARFATVKAAQDLFGETIAKIMSDTWTSVGVGTTNQAPVDPKDKYQENIPINPGQDLILFTSGIQANLFIMNTQQEVIFNPLSNISPISKPSISDDGKFIVVVDKDKKAKLITVDYNKRTKTEQTILTNNNFRNAIISKNGTLMAFLLDELEPYIYLIDFSKTPAQQKFIKLKSPTTAQGKSTGNVEYADAMEFDHSGEFIMYDALNKIKSPTAGEISFWDISFVKAFDNKSKTLLDTTKQVFSKLFSLLPEGISIGNATFSKNSPHIIAFDYLDDNKKENKILGANIETGDVDIIADLTALGIPTFSKTDNLVLFQTPSFFSGKNISSVQIDATKIKSANPAPVQVRTNASLPVWFATGVRVLTDLNNVDITNDNITVYPNPFTNKITVDLSKLENISSSLLQIEVFDHLGKKVYTNIIDIIKEGKLYSLDANNLISGMYNIKITNGSKVYTNRILKL